MIQIPKWEIFEITLTSDRDFDNPFIDVDLKLVLQSGTRKASVDGFYDGRDNNGVHVWKVRFAPPHKGEWEYRTVSNIGELDKRTGKFECISPVSRGPLAVRPQFPNWFFREDGNPQFIINDGWYPHPLFDMHLPHERLDFQQPSGDDFETFLDILGTHGVNLTIGTSQLYARQSSITDDSFAWPWEVTDPAANKIDRDRFNLKYYRRMENVLAHAKTLGVFYGVDLLFDNSTIREREWSHHPLNVDNGGWIHAMNGIGEPDIGWANVFDLDNPENIKYTAKYLKYAVARLSAYWNIYWAVGTEGASMDPNMRDIFIKWHRHWGEYVASHDPHGRLQSIGDAGSHPELVRHSRNNIFLTQEHTSMDDQRAFCDAVNSYGQIIWAHGRPVVIGEQDRHNVGNYETERKGFWSALTGGYHMGRVDRHFGIISNGRLCESEILGIDGIPPIYEYLKIMAKFIEQSGVRFWKMSPHNELLIRPTGGIYCLAEPDTEYLLYFSNGGAVELCLPASRCEWFNPRNGEFCPAEEIPEGTAAFAAPDSNDWVLHIHVVG